MSKSKQCTKKSSEKLGSFRSLIESPRFFRSYYLPKEPQFCYGCKNRIINDSEHYQVEDLSACLNCLLVIQHIRRGTPYTDPRLIHPKKLFALVLPRVSYSYFCQELETEHAKDLDQPWGFEPEMSFEKRGLLKIREYRRTKIQICYLDILKV